jgi:long-chain acyl-CoA synthetase
MRPREPRRGRQPPTQAGPDRPMVLTGASDLLAERAARSADRPAIVMGSSGATTTYRELESRSARLANVLRSLGCGRADVIAILMENHVRYLEVAWAAQRSGLYYTAVNWHLTPDEVAYIIGDSGARVLVTTTAQADTVRRLAGRMPGIETVLCMDGAMSGATSYPDSSWQQLGDVLDDPAEGCELLYSSGTTGRPKAIKRPLPPAGELVPSHDAARAMYRDVYGAGEDTVYLSPAPLYHSAPLMSCMTIHRLGGAVVVMERFDAENALALIERQQVTIAQFVPTMFVRMLKLAPELRASFDVSSLRCAIHASAPCPVEVKRQMIEWWGPVLYEYYSGTESMGATRIDSAEWLRHPGSVGRPSGFAIHVIGDDGREVAAGVTGVIYFESDRKFEYLNDPAKTQSITEGHGWRTLGDIGYLDAEGYLYLTDRATFMIISGGVNIYPQEIEDLLTMHPKVADVAVFGVPNDDLGEEVKAVIQPAAGIRPDDALADELIAFCRDHLAHYKAPRSVDFVEALPRDPNGKLYKRQLRDGFRDRPARQSA